MRAAVLYGIRDLRFSGDYKTPSVSGSEVLLKVLAAGICGSDLSRYAKKGPYNDRLIMGHEVYGEVVDKGPNAHAVKLGDRGVLILTIPCRNCEWCQKGQFSMCENNVVFGAGKDGGFAEYMVLDETSVFPVPESLKPDQAVFVEPLATVMHALNRVRIYPGDSVAVLGAGTMGALSAKIAHLLGAAEIFVSDIDDFNLDRVRDLVPCHTINATESDPVKVILDMTSGRGVDVVVEAAGVPETEEQAFHVPKRRGRVVFVGISYRDPNLSSRAFQNIGRKELTLKGTWLSHSYPFPGSEWHWAVSALADGRVDPVSLISKRATLEELPQLFEQLATRNVRCVKAVVYPNRR